MSFCLLASRLQSVLSRLPVCRSLTGGCGPAPTAGSLAPPQSLSKAKLYSFRFSPISSFSTSSSSSFSRSSSPAPMAGSSKESAANNPGLVEDVDVATKEYIMQQTMYRIKDPQVSLKFYSEVLGMRLLKRLDFPGASFTVYFMGYEDPASIPTDPEENMKWFCKTKGTIELTHNWGTESDPDFKGYHNGNTEPRGWGHIGIMVDDVYKACERFEKLGVEFVKKPDDGRMKGLGFIKDPDGYWIEILAYPQMGNILAAAT